MRDYAKKDYKNQSSKYEKLYLLLVPCMFALVGTIELWGT